MIEKFMMTGAVASLAMAAVAGTANAGACTPEALSNYVLAGFSCTIGDKTFSDFTYTPGTSGTGVASAATAVSVAPQGTPEWGFTFTGIWNSGTNGVGDAGLSYTVAVTDGQPLIDSASLVLTGSLSGTGATGTVGETICENVSCSVSDFLTVDLAGSHSDTVLPLTSGPVSVVYVSKDIDAMSNGSGGTASISVVTNTVDQVSVPEPASLALLGSALVGFGAFRRRRKTG